MNQQFKILSIDGGGIRGILPCQILADLENDLIRREGPESRLCDYFDLIAGTSTGGIIAIGLALGVKAQTILDLYIEHGEEIFPRFNQSRVSKALRTLIGKPFYDRKRLKQLITDAYELGSGIRGVRLGHAKSRLIIPTYCLESRAINILKTSHSDKLQRDYQIPAVEAALCTAAAPAYFTPHDFAYEYVNKEGSSVCNKMIDGGIVANNPTFLALLEALKCLDKPLSGISILSLGTGLSKKECPQRSDKFHPWFWSNPTKGPMIYEIMAEAQSILVDNMIKVYKNGVGATSDDQFNYIRLQHTFMESEEIGLDSTSKKNTSKMRHVAQQIYKENCCQLHDIFLSQRKEDFIPSHKL